VKGTGTPVSTSGAALVTHRKAVRTLASFFQKGKHFFFGDGRFIFRRKDKVSILTERASQVAAAQKNRSSEMLRVI